MNSLRTPLARAKGLGSVKHGVGHWWWQRVTAIALVLLGVWFVYTLVSLIGADHRTVVALLQSPVQAMLLILFICTTFFHSFLGLQVVVEDYIHSESVKITCLVVIKLVSVALTLLSVIIVLQIATGI